MNLKKETEYGLCKFVATKGEICYEEVLDDFKNASYIYVLTYNISPKDTTLINKLNAVDADTDIRFFTNIPSRFNVYYRDTFKENASKTINNYLEILNLDNFNSRFEVNFLFENHSKIVMTDNIAYIGSANYSNESRGNFETGLITLDKKMINSIKAIIDEETFKIKVPYYKTNIIPVLLLARNIEVYIAELNENIFNLSELLYDVLEIRNPEIKSIELFNDLKEEILRIIQNLIAECDDEESTLILDKLLELEEEVENYKIEDEVIEFLKFDKDSYIKSEISEHSFNLTEDNLEEILPIIYNEANIVKEELVNDAQDSLYNLESNLNGFLTRILEVIDILKKDINSKIDNTK